MSVSLNDVEQRVLGVLIEKSLTQPAGYPLTVNAITLGANQKQNREPVVEYTEGEVSAALRRLEHKRLVTQSPPAIGARAVRFQHGVVEVFRWDRREQAIMAELLLRGRQTPGELRTHASRMTPFADLDSVLSTLATLRAYDTPFVEELPREPGRSANRFRHLMGAEGNSIESKSQPSDAGAEVHSLGAPYSPTKDSSIRQPPVDGALAERVARLEIEVARLRDVVAALGSENRRAFDLDHTDGV